MTAPVLHHYHNGERPPLRDSTLYKIGPAFGSAHWRLSTGQPRSARGDLWEREAERDVQAHGKPLVHVYREDWRRGPTLQSGAWPATWRRYIAAEVERRRPAMRATRAHLEPPISETSEP